MPLSVHSDAPAIKDLLNFGRYLNPLLDILQSGSLQTPVTIGVFGTWGSGKSTLLGLLKQALPATFVCVEFNPWVFRKEPNLLIPLLQSLNDALTRRPSEKFKASAAKIADVLVHLGADVLLKSITFDKVTLENLEKLERAYLMRKGQIDSQLRNLREALRKLAEGLKKEATIILLIDDLDRCDPIEIIDLLESLKLFLDVENVVTVLAVDKEVIDRGVEVKYGKFKFGEERGPALGSEYMEKMVQIPVYLYPLHPDQVRGYIRAHDLSQAVEAHMELLVAALRPNPRKIKRVLNAIALTEAALKDSALDRRLTTGLTVLRIEEPDFYADAARLPKLLVALQNVFGINISGKQWSTRDITDFSKDFGDKAAFARERCARYNQQAGALAAVYQHCNFAAAREPLSEYVSVVGGR
jgi:hypothetical protein